MVNSKKIVSVILSGIMLFAGEMTLAQSPTDGTSPGSLVIQLNAQLKALKEQAAKLKEIKQDVKETHREFKITRSLFRGLEGDDVRELQKLLAEDPDIYPEALITGFFGSLTENAVRRFQKKHGIE